MYVLEDYGEPSCWCCNKAIIVKDEEKLQQEGNFKEIWNGTAGKLERCHIVPKSLGGSYEPSNLFLMCHNCHLKAPNILNGNMFLKWVSIHRKKCALGLNLVEYTEYTSVLCKEFGIDLNSFVDFMNTYDKDKLMKKISTHGVHVNMSTTLLGWINEFIEQKLLIHIEAV
ncbi:hypothetical protein CYJ37_11425 [Bacillus sp. UMB0728]|nr:hypothetical protein CYJ37_11425 [Bacillus sp. UMB0728]